MNKPIKPSPAKHTEYKSILSTIREALTDSKVAITYPASCYDDLLAAIQFAEHQIPVADADILLRNIGNHRAVVAHWLGYVGAKISSVEEDADSLEAMAYVSVKDILAKATETEIKKRVAAQLSSNATYCDTKKELKIWHRLYSTIKVLLEEALNRETIISLAYNERHKE